MPTSSLNPSFPGERAEPAQAAAAGSPQGPRRRAEQTAAAVFPRLIYGPDHPYGRPDAGTARSVESITRDDAVAFYKRIMVPGNAALVVVGDVRPDTITAALEVAIADMGARPGTSRLRRSYLRPSTPRRATI